MAAALREGAALEGWQLQSVAEALKLQPHQSGAMAPEQEQGWRQRIDELIQSGNFDTAERMADTALNQFPASAELALLREKARQKAQARESGSPEAGQGEAPSEDEAELRQTLLRLVASEASGDWERAVDTLHAALERRPELTAYRIAEVYLKGKLAGGGTEDGK
jgi:hypothetical protein